MESRKLNSATFRSCSQCRELLSIGQYPFVHRGGAGDSSTHYRLVTRGSDHLRAVRTSRAYLAVSFGYSLEFGGRDAFRRELYVNDSARGQGRQSGASRRGAALSHRRNPRPHLEVERTNQTAKDLYEQSGFREHTRHLMTKKLV